MQPEGRELQLLGAKPSLLRTWTCLLYRSWHQQSTKPLVGQVSQSIIINFSQFNLSGLDGDGQEPDAHNLLSSPCCLIQLTSLWKSTILSCVYTQSLHNLITWFHNFLCVTSASLLHSWLTVYIWHLSFSHDDFYHCSVSTTFSSVPIIYYIVYSFYHIFASSDHAQPSLLPDLPYVFIRLYHLLYYIAKITQNDGF